MQFGFLLEQVVNGLVLGGYYLLIALGLSLIFSVGGIVNLAHGAFYALGAYISVEITKYLGFGSAVVLSPIAVGAARHSLRALHPAPVLRRRSDPEPVGDVRARHGHRTGDPDYLGRAADIGCDPAGPSRLGLPRRLPVLALSPPDPRRRRRRSSSASGCCCTRPRSAAWCAPASSGRTWSPRWAFGCSPT